MAADRRAALEQDQRPDRTGIPVVLSDDAEDLAREVARAGVPELQPGERFEIELPVEMPHDPVRLRVEIDPNFGDRDPSNDWWECFFGAPPPAPFPDCGVSPVDDGLPCETQPGCLR